MKNNEGDVTHTMELTVGTIVDGVVKTITKFGAFVALPDNQTGMVHISEIAHSYVNDIHEHLKPEQPVRVMVIAMDGGKINLSIKRTIEVVKVQRPPQNRGNFDRPRPQQNRPRQSFDRSRGNNQPKEPATFDDMLKQFMSDSDSKISTIKQYSEHKKRRR